MDHKKKSPYRLLFSLSEYAEVSSSNVVYISIFSKCPFFLITGQQSLDLIAYKDFIINVTIN